MRKIYRKIARKHGVSVAEVKCQMQDAINAAYRNPPDNGVTRALQNRVPRKGEIPTADEFIRYGAEKIRREYGASE